MNEEIEKFELLLDKFKQLCNPTFMNVSGFSKRENIWSNILAFFLDDKASHKMRNLWARSLLECAGVTSKEAKEFKHIIAKREFSTIKGNRLDILAIGNNCVIGIENKVYSEVKNDLQDYANTINDIANLKNIRSKKILLTLNNEETIAKSIGNDWINVLYSDLVNQVRQNLGEYFQTADTKWIILMKDFINTIGEKDMELDITMMRFFIDNFEDIKNLKDKFDKIESYMKDACNNLEKMLKSDINSKFNIIKSGKASESSSKNTFLDYYVFIMFQTQNGELKIQADIGGDNQDNWCISLFYQSKNMAPGILAKKLEEQNISFLKSFDKENWIRLELHKIGETSVEQIKNRMIHYVEQLKIIGLLN